MANIKTRTVSFSSVHDSEVWPSLKSAVTFRVVYWGQLFLLRVVDMEAWIWSRLGTHTPTPTHTLKQPKAVFGTTQGLAFNLSVLRGISLHFGVQTDTNIPRGRDRLIQGKNRQLGQRGGDQSEPDVLSLDVLAPQMLWLYKGRSYQIGCIRFF